MEIIYVLAGLGYTFLSAYYNPPEDITKDLLAAILAVCVCTIIWPLLVLLDLLEYVAGKGKKRGKGD